jgi:endo-1,4-beta-xylanase
MRPPVIRAFFPFLLTLCLLCFLRAFAALSEAPTLRDVALHPRILIGAAVRPAQLSEPAYAATLAREFNMLEPEDALKWEVLRPDAQSFDFSQADQLVDFALRHDMKVRGHTLVWHRQIPPWLANGHYNSAELSTLLETHIKTVVAHYRGKVFAWDVVNEAFDEGKRTGEPRETFWSNINAALTQTSDSQLETRDSKLAYIAQCFRWAHEADPGALLFYNEAEAEELNPKSDAIYAMARSFLRDVVPINGIGLEMHIPNLHPNIASISSNISRFTALGLQVHITEMDVPLPVDSAGNASPADLQSQAEIYRQIASACLSHPGCTAIQTWGFTDKYSWIGSHSKHTQGAALVFDRNYRPKPAYDALRSALSQAP